MGFQYHITQLTFALSNVQIWHPVRCYSKGSFITYGLGQQILNVGGNEIEWREKRVTYFEQFPKRGAKSFEKGVFLMFLIHSFWDIFCSMGGDKFVVSWGVKFYPKNRPDQNFWWIMGSALEGLFRTPSSTGRKLWNSPEIWSTKITWESQDIRTTFV